MYGGVETDSEEEESESEWEKENKVRKDIIKTVFFHFFQKKTKKQNRVMPHKCPVNWEMRMLF